MHQSLTSIGLTVLFCALLASPAVADNHEMVEDGDVAAETSTGDVADPAPTPISEIAVPGDFSSKPTQSGMDHWNEQNPWRYGTEYLFPLTRGLERSGLPSFLQPAAMVFTVPFDLGNLPLGAVAGLFGS
jgi:hypothetical protein